MVVEARSLVDNADQKESFLDNVTIQALNALGYEEAAQNVYGMTYGDWKKRHQKKATDEQMQKYKASSSMHAKHDKALLATRASPPNVATPTVACENPAASTTINTTTLLSNVCCQTMDEEETAKESSSPVTKKSRTLPPYQPAPMPVYPQPTPLRVAILTVSDRASQGAYETGDLSGPAVQDALQQALGVISNLQLEISYTAIVPDQVKAIVQQLQSWCESTTPVVDLILTTGGTGLSPRDVTPEATRSILQTECAGLMSFVLMECAKIQPLATLSRGTVGLVPNAASSSCTLVANLPGNPQAVQEIMPLLLPLLLHAKTHL